MGNNAMSNTFDLNKMNHALYVANVDNVQLDRDGYECAQTISDTAFKQMGVFTNKHGHITNRCFSTYKKDEILGMLIDEMSDEVLKKSIN